MYSNFLAKTLNKSVCPTGHNPNNNNNNKKRHLIDFFSSFFEDTKVSQKMHSNFQADTEQKCVSNRAHPNNNNKKRHPIGFFLLFFLLFLGYKSVTENAFELSGRH